MISNPNSHCKSVSSRRSAQQEARNAKVSDYTSEDLRPLMDMFGSFQYILFHTRRMFE